MGIVHSRFPALQDAELRAREAKILAEESHGEIELQARNKTMSLKSLSQHPEDISQVGRFMSSGPKHVFDSIRKMVLLELGDWKEFAVMPVFISEFEILEMNLEILIQQMISIV